MNRKKDFYEIELPDKKAKPIKLWFMGNQLDIVLSAYNIPHKKNGWNVAGLWNGAVIRYRKIPENEPKKKGYFFKKYFNKK